MSTEVDLGIPGDLQKELDDLFPESAERRKIASVLMFWPAKPTWKEAEKIGKTVGRSASTVGKVVRILIENCHFSKELGSMPLWRYTNNKKGMSLTGPQREQVPPSGLLTGEEDLGNGEDHSSPNGDNGKTEGFSGAFPGIYQEVSDRFTAQQREIEGLKRVRDTRFDELKEIMTGGRTVIELTRNPFQVLKKTLEILFITP